MDDMRNRLERINEGHEVVNETVEGLSVIVRSFEEKLEQCGGSYHEMEVRTEEEERGEKELLEHLEKDCERSYEVQRSKMVELDEVKEALKMTKDVNRELM